MSKILILKNDRIGDLFHSIEGINSIINNNKNSQIEIILSPYSKKTSFLFKVPNVETSILNYRLSVYEKIFLLKKVFFGKFDRIYILAPKSFYFVLPFFCSAKFYAVCVDDVNTVRPYKFLRKKLFKFVVNNRKYKKINESISCLNNRLCKEVGSNNLDVLNKSPVISDFLSQNINLFSNYVHIHYKDSLFKKNNWTLNIFTSLLKKINKLNYKVVLTSDLGSKDYNNFFLQNFSFLNFENNTSFGLDNLKIIYLHNINISDIFKIIEMSNLVISPHGTMTVLASYLKIKVIDIFDTNITINSFREFKPKNQNYNFLILKSDSDKVFNKILKFIK
jgi:ADP-heptose:LPS heptosyltransferase